MAVSNMYQIVVNNTVDISVPGTEQMELMSLLDVEKGIGHWDYARYR